MSQVLEDAGKLAHGTYDDVIVVEHRKQASAAMPGRSADAPQGSVSSLHVVLEMPEGSRVVHTAPTYEIDGVVSDAPPAVGRSYRLIVAPSAGQVAHGDATPGSALRYETMNA